MPHLIKGNEQATADLAWKGDTDMTKANELNRALRHFAETYFGAVVGSEWDEACDYAESVANRFRWQGSDTPRNDRAVADHLYCEACRYSNM